jgi:hypothetical protein
LIAHCEFRKYAQHAAQWFGIVLDPPTGKLRGVLHFEHEWKADEKMELMVRERSKAGS